MGSRKRSAKARQIAEFKAQLADDASSEDGRGVWMDDLFAREDARREELAEQHESTLRWKACEKKQRYTTRADAEATIAACERHGTHGLHCYRCKYCNGWHLTSHRHLPSTYGNPPK